MKILVTGANGYLGKGVVKALIDDGQEVVATDMNDKYIDKRATLLKGDLFYLEDPYTYFGKPDILLHMAWRDGFVHGSMNHINDLPKHVEFINKMIESGVKHVAVMGSMHEVGFYEGSINENTPCNPQSLYGISKNALRRIVELECKNKNVKFQWLRGFYIVGNTEDGSSIFSKIVQAAHKGQKEFPFTMGLNQFDFLDYDVFCQEVADAVEQSEVDGIINICCGRPEKLADRVERFIKENGFDITLNYGAFPDRPYDSKAIWGDDFKIRMIEKMKG
ncbi:MAG: NAD(P)-dependent oxidoreductase [Absicoccus porci]|uniref:NAD-dependent epimerase/dehydratase family protein n=1 Tax=Absicoccus porci TaxID=2486576 RepID=UPI0023F347E6|nr:NAD(P)-dependent oxidoreductase [Absicoccus porci]MDD7331042.1 NAD(P)-dependent oxidoreductase [Absicoccus porci]MDY4738002.1 NAD(P)-dependent oxidoreductase [Absicoccus porci]